MSRDIFANGFGQTGGCDTNHFWFILFDNIFDSGNKIFTASKNSRLFAEIARSNIYRLFVMTYHIAPDIGGATLTSMDKRYASFNPFKNQ